MNLREQVKNKLGQNGRYNLDELNDKNLVETISEDFLKYTLAENQELIDFYNGEFILYQDNIIFFNQIEKRLKDDLEFQEIFTNINIITNYDLESLLDEHV